MCRLTLFLTLIAALGSCTEAGQEQRGATAAATEMESTAADTAEYAAVQEAIVSHYADYLFAIEAQTLYEVPGMLIGRDSKVSFSNGRLYAVDFEDMKLGESGRRIAFFDESAALSYLYTLRGDNGNYTTHFYSPHEGGYLAFRQTSLLEGNIVALDNEGLLSDQRVDYEIAEAVEKARLICEEALRSNGEARGGKYFSGDLIDGRRIQWRVGPQAGALQGIYLIEGGEEKTFYVDDMHLSTFVLRTNFTDHADTLFVGGRTAEGTIEGEWRLGRGDEALPCTLSEVQEFSRPDGHRLMKMAHADSGLDSEVITFDLQDLPEASAVLMTDFAEVDYLAAYCPGLNGVQDHFAAQAVNYVFDAFARSKEEGEFSKMKSRYLYNIVMPLPDFVPLTKRHHGYYASDAASIDPLDRLKAYMAHSISRDPDNIERLWRLLGPGILETIDSVDHVAYGIDTTIELLLNAHTHLAVQEGYVQALKSAYAQVDSLDRAAFARGQLDPSLQTTAATALPILRPLIEGGDDEPSADEIGIDEDTLWAYSFWMRRYQEGNGEVVHRILQEIETHYETYIYTAFGC